MYKQKYQAKQKGKIGIVLSTQFKEPLCDSNPLDVAAAERNLQFYLGWFASPIFKVRFADASGFSLGIRPQHLTFDVFEINSTRRRGTIRP